MNNHASDLTQGGILKKLLLVAVPIMGTQFLQMAYNLTDMFWLGRMSDATTAVAASGMGGMFLWLSSGLMMIGRMGSEIGVAQNLGRGDKPAAKQYAQNAIMISLYLGLAFGLCMVAFAEPLISLFHLQEREVVDASVTYMRITGIGIPITYISAAITGTFNGSGNSRLTFYANAVGLIVNMILDPLMILVFGWGVGGAAIATVIAQGVVCLLFVVLGKRHPQRPFETFELLTKLKWDKSRDIVRWSLPIAVESTFFTLLSMVVTELTGRFGQNALAVMRVGGQIESLSWMIGGGFSSAVTAFVGQNFGARKWHRIHTGFKISIGAMSVWGILVTVLLFTCGRPLFAIFLPDPEILRMGEDYLKILAFCQLSMCIEMTCAGAFRGVGLTIPPSLSSIVSNVLRVPLCYFLAATSLGLYGIWIGVTASAVGRGVAVAVWYAISSRRWPKKGEGDTAPAPAP